MFSQFKRIQGRCVFIKQISPSTFELTVDNGMPVTVQPHKPATWFAIFELALRNDEQYNFQFEDDLMEAGEDAPPFDDTLFNKHFSNK